MNTLSSKEDPPTEDTQDVFLADRGLTSKTMEFYQIVTTLKDGQPLRVTFPYGKESAKIRRQNVPKKESFYTKGPIRKAGLFGKERFSAGSARAITITEGEYDAPSVYQMLGSKYPAVSVQSSTTAKEDCDQDLEYLNSFEKIYLCFDKDEQGQKAAAEVASLFDPLKVYLVKLSAFKDANDYLKAHKEADFKNIWFNARRFDRNNVLSSYDEIDRVIDEAQDQESVPYPFKTLDEMTYGIRTGECVLVTALEGRGKTEFVRAIEFNLIKNTDANIGLIHLEEPPKRLVKGLVGYELGAPVHLPDSNVDKDTIKDTYRRLTKRDDRVFIYSHFGSDSPRTIVNSIRFLVASCGCKYIVLDHISMIVSGLEDTDERKTLDILSTDLEMLVQELDFALIFVSHVNDEGLTRGSRNISKIAHLHVHLDRDVEAPTEALRNITHLMVRKNRFGARTGPAGKLYFDPISFTVREVLADLPPTTSEDT